MSMGLDLAATHFRSLRSVNEELVGRQCRAVYVTLSDTTGHRRLLEQAGTRFAPCGDDLVLFGEAALEWADMLNLTVIPLLPDGRVPQSDAVARQILTLMIDAVLPAAERLGDVCCLTVPGGHDVNRAHQHYDVRFFQQVVALRGYQPRLIAPGMALVLAELADASFSGLGLHLDESDCQISVVHCGRELAFCSVPGLACSRRAKPDLVEQALLQMLIDAREELLREGSIRLLGQPIQIAVAGELATPDEFAALLGRVWKQAGDPFVLGAIRVTSPESYSVARGCLIQARLESQDLGQKAA